MAARTIRVEVVSMGFDDAVDREESGACRHELIVPRITDEGEQTGEQECSICHESVKAVGPDYDVL
jgi:hypothetical protein